MPKRPPTSPLPRLISLFSSPWPVAAAAVLGVTLTSAFLAAGAVTLPFDQDRPVSAFGPVHPSIRSTEGAIAPPTTSTTVPPTTTAPTTVAPRPTTLPPTTAAPTTVPPTTVATTAPPATTPPEPPPVIVETVPVPPPPPPPPPPAVATAAPGAASQFLSSINGLRAARGAPALAPMAALNGVAQRWADHMASSQTLAHNPSVQSQIPGGWTAWAENVGYGGSVSQVQSALQASSGHYANMVNPGLRQIGIGVAVDSSGVVWTAHVFGSY